MIASALLLGCQLFVDSGVGAGLNSPCKADSDCQAAKCIEGFCGQRECNGDDCATTSQSSSSSSSSQSGGGCDGGGGCAPLDALRVAFIYLGDPSGGDDLSFAHDEGRKAAEAALGGAVTTETVIAYDSRFEGPPAVDPGRPDVATALDELLRPERGVKAIVAASPSMEGVMAEKAASHPDVKFLTYGATRATGNHLGYSDRMYQAAYVAGAVTMIRSNSKKIGIVAGYVTPAAVAYINAFALGARSVVAYGQVYVRWVGYPHHPEGSTEPTEDTFAVSLRDTMNCDVIAYLVDNAKLLVPIFAQPPLAYGVGMYRLGSCPTGNPRCAATTFAAWGPYYTSLFQDLDAAFQKGNNQLLPGSVNAPDSVVRFELSDAFSDYQGQVDTLLADDDPSRPTAAHPFVGPLCWNEGSTSDCLPSGVSLSDAEILNMCRFVLDADVGRKPLVVTAGELDKALVPAEGGCAPP